MTELTGEFQIIGLSRGFGDFVSVAAHGVEMHLAGGTNQALDLLQRIADRDTSWKVRDIGAVAIGTLLVNDEVFQVVLSSR